MTRSPALPILLALLFAMLIAPTATAQAPDTDPITIIETTPRANAVLEEGPPATVSITFSTAIDPDASEIRLVDETGTPLPDTATAWDGASAAVALPPELPTGTWLVAWKVSAASGDAEGSGFYGFAVGLGEDVAPLTLPETGFDTSTGPAWLARISTAALVTGVLVLVAIWPVRTLLTRSMPLTISDRRRLQVLAAAAAAVSALGAAGRLAAEAWDAPAASWAAGLVDVLAEGRPGWALLTTVLLVSLHSVLLALLTADLTGTRRLLPWVTTVALAVPLAVLSHAGAEPAGRIPTLTVTLIALLVLGILAGGAVVLAWLRKPPPARAWLAVATGAPILLLAGAYLGWLNIGNSAALASTPYGAVAIVTAIAGVAFLLALGGSLAASGRWLVVPAVLGIALAGLNGVLMAEETARAAFEQEATQRVVPLDLGDDRAQLILAPGAAGVNHVRLEVYRATLSRQTEATLTVTLPSSGALGAQTVPLSRVGATAFEHHGAELAIAGEWQLSIALEEPGRPAEATAALALPADVEPADAPGTPWRFTDFAGSAGVLMVAIGIAGLVIAAAAGRSSARMESAGLGIAALALAAILLGQGRLDPILAAGGDGGSGAIDPDDVTLVARGEEIYVEQCLSCHGPELRGDGPAAAGMQPPPADFAAPHTRVHDEATLIYWLRNGKQGTAMPAFGDVLSDEEIRAVLSYIEREQRDLTNVATPAP